MASQVAHWLRICLQGRRPGFDPWLGKIPWRREWLPISVFLPGEFHRGARQATVGLSALLAAILNFQGVYFFYNSFKASIHNLYYPDELNKWGDGGAQESQAPRD